MKRPARAITYSLLIVLLLIVTFVFPKQAPEAHAQGATLSNPLLTGPVDPYVIYVNGYYYYTGTTATNIQVWRSATIAGLASATPVTVWTPTAGTPDCCDLWAPEIHYINNTWYIYYAADGGSDSSHRIFVLQANSSDPLGSYSEANTGNPHGQLSESSNLWAIDPNVFQDSSGKLFAVWSGWPTASGGVQNIYIASMSDPLHISSNRVQISAPTRSWETHGFGVNEGPVGFTHNGKTFITYSASFCGTVIQNLDIYGQAISDVWFLLHPGQFHLILLSSQRCPVHRLQSRVTHGTPSLCQVCQIIGCVDITIDHQTACMANKDAFA